MSPRLRANVCLFAFVLCQVVGAVLFAKGMTGISRPFFAWDWQEAEGCVLDIRERPQPIFRPEFFPVLAYSFTVGDSTYVGTRLSFGPDLYSDVKAARQFRRGEPVTVLYNPANPWDCVLFPRVRSAAILLLLLGILSWAGSFGCARMCWGVRKD